MSRFTADHSKSVPKLNTASLPDIVFMILFFFMVSTQMRDVEVKVKVAVPTGSQVKKLEKKSLVSNIYIGRPVPSMQAKYGTEPLIQMNDKLVNEEGVPEESVKDFILFEREKLSEADQNRMTVSLKIDSHIPMGAVTDLKQALRMANALKISYSARKDVSAESPR